MRTLQYKDRKGCFPGAAQRPTWLLASGLAQVGQCDSGGPSITAEGRERVICALPNRATTQREPEPCTWMRDGPVRSDRSAERCPGAAKPVPWKGWVITVLPAEPRGVKITWRQGPWSLQWQRALDKTPGASLRRGQTHRGRASLPEHLTPPSLPPAPSQEGRGDKQRDADSLPGRPTPGHGDHWCSSSGPSNGFLPCLGCSHVFGGRCGPV